MYGETSPSGGNLTDFTEFMGIILLTKSCDSRPKVVFLSDVCLYGRVYKQEI